MNKILVIISKDSINFSIYTKKIDEININNTNIIDTKNLKFTEEYILNNLELLCSFINLLIIKQNINKVVIKNNEIAETVLKVINNIKIEKIIFKEDKDLNYTISSLLLENKYIKQVECFNMPELMYKRFKIDVITRNKIPFKSEFMKYNKIETYSDLCKKEKIVINNYLTKNDVDDIIYFFNQTNSLKKITIKGYNRNNLLAFLDMLKNNNLKNILIILVEDKEISQNLLKDVQLFLKLNKKYNVKIKIKYSNEYKENNFLKEINIKLLKQILIVIIFFLIILIIIIKKQEFSDNKKTLENLNQIEETLKENNINENIDSTFDINKDEYEKLYKLNNDTFGILKVKNTKINYPVVQSSDNEFYLNHSFDKSKNIAGWIFMDYRVNKMYPNQNIIIYGHDMKDDTMFGSLSNVLKSDWLNNKDNFVIDFNIKGVLHKYQIFSIYITDLRDNYLIIDFENNEFNQYVKKIKNKSIKKFNVDIKEDDNILTLSTCYGNDRLVVHAKMIK